MKWVADENFDYDILRGILRRNNQFDVVRAQDVEEISGRDDVTLLTWATREERVLLTHDVTTMISALRQVMARQGRCSPVVLVSDSAAISDAVEDILLLEQCASDADWEAGLLFVPLRR